MSNIFTQRGGEQLSGRTGHAKKQKESFAISWSMMPGKKEAAMITDEERRSDEPGDVV